jgi:hypothetical protein
MQNLLRGGPGQKVPEMRVAVFRADQRAIAHDHGQGGIQLMSHGHGKVIAPPGDQRHLDAPAGCFRNSGLVGLRKLPAAIQQRSVDIQRDQSYCHS